MGARLRGVLVDTHVLVWWSAEPGRLSPAADRAIEEAESVAVAAITWYELAWLAKRGRLGMSLDARAWLDELDARVRTIPISPAIAATAAGLPESFPRDPADRLIYATAFEHGLPLVTKDQRLRRHRRGGPATVW